MLQSLSDRQTVFVVYLHHSRRTMTISTPEPAHSSAALPVDANRAPEESQTTHLVSITCHVENHEPNPLGLRPRRQHYVPQLLCGRLGVFSCTGKHTAVVARQVIKVTATNSKRISAQLFQDRRTAQLHYQRSCQSPSITAESNLLLSSSASDSSDLRDSSRTWEHVVCTSNDKHTKHQ